MVLTVNVSNSTVLLGGYEAGKRCFRACLHTDLSQSADEYAVQMRAVLSLHGAQTGALAGVIFSCVVPPLFSRIRAALQLLYAGRIYHVGPGLKTGLAIRMDDPGELGGELVCCAVAAKVRYPLPCVVVSLDTAISMTALDAAGAVCGVSLMPGVRTGVDALCVRTAQLPQIDLAAPACGVLGTNSAACMQAGAVLGTASMLDGMLDRFAEALGAVPTCVATGEPAAIVLPHCRHPHRLHEDLVLDGLYDLYLKNAK